MTEDADADAVAQPPRAPAAADPTSRQRAYRDALGAFATGVTVVAIPASPNTATQNTATPGAPAEDAGRRRGLFGGRPAAATTAPSPMGLGITANSFASVSLDPPLVLWCLDTASNRFAEFSDAQSFAISVLSADQEALARRFAADAVIPGGDPHFVAAPNGAPWLEPSAARFACQAHARHQAGDHVILIGRVVAFNGPSDGPLLGFRTGGFTRVD